ncbi:MAG: BMP family ABC transporter substrate-binding protein [Succinivibrio sp.]|nr:BMP family ABC transporter substrate-binding protein [Succinivibrio sp.]
MAWQGLGSDRQFKVLLLAVSALSALVLLAVLVIVLSLGRGESEETRTVGFITLGDITQPGWNSTQYQGIKKACDSFGVRLMVKQHIAENSGLCPQAVRELVQEGAQMIFLASYSYSAEVRDLVPTLPQTAFATNSAEVHARNMTSYYVRMYEARYLAGALAGLRTKSGVVGYVAAMKNSEVNRGINAFALGVQRTNPQARVAVLWTGHWQDEQKEAENARRLITEAGADVLTYHQDERAVADTAEELGVDFISYHEALDGYSEHNLGAVLCRWDLYYADMVQRFLKGELNAVQNRWLGLADGVVDLRLISPALTPDLRQTIAALREELKEQFIVFSGELYDNQGVQRCAQEESISDEALLERTDYLLQGVYELE